MLLLAIMALLAVSTAVWRSSASRIARPAVPVAGTGPFDPAREADAIQSALLSGRFEPLPKRARNYRIGVIMKFLGNHYWQLLAAGMQSRADELGVRLDIRAPSTESDTSGQLELFEGMLYRNYDAYLVSPQTDLNLRSALLQARSRGQMVLNVNDAVLYEAEHWIGPNQYENGVRVAQHLKAIMPEGGEVAVIMGLAGSYAVINRTAGFVDTLEGSPFTVVAKEGADWDLHRALQVSSGILDRYPRLRAFYCNNDIMAFGVVEAVKRRNKLGKVLVFGTDGIPAAYDSIRRGELAGTVDSFPQETGRIAMEVAVRLLEGQKLPRVIFSPQALITRETLNRADALPRGNEAR
ncbi:substrate-binding domain-containing protein [Holophaga foetida]|uniref:sugar ABC transporter substrate-binding protein n=1 Tax=Holophaga foetida TaxID=35839 RepID=UPI00130DF598|nr:substrate-binding domain-containing protein [Holophaga foetida]